jgi:hypothetical protein
MDIILVPMFGSERCLWSWHQPILSAEPEEMHRSLMINCVV